MKIWLLLYYTKMKIYPLSNVVLYKVVLFNLKVNLTWIISKDAKLYWKYVTATNEYMVLLRFNWAVIKILPFY